MPNDNYAPGAGPRGLPGVDGSDATLTTRQLQQLGCVPTLIGLTPTAQTGGGTFHNVTRGSAQVGYRLTTSAPGRTWTGLSSAGITDGECFQFHNDGPTPFTFAHETTSAAFNQFSLPGGRDLVLEAGEHVVFTYDGIGGSAGKWTVVTDGDSEPAAAPPLTARQLQQLACSPTTVGLDGAGGTSNSPAAGSGFPPGGVGWRFLQTGSVTWTGVQPPAGGYVAGQCVQFYNGSNFSQNLTHNGATPTANGFQNPGGRTLVLEPGEHAIYVYDATLSRWVLVGDGDSEPAATLTPAQVRRNTCIPTTEGLNNYAPTGTQNSVAYPAGGVGYSFTGTAPLTVTGMVQQTAGTCVHWWNATTAQPVTFVHNNGTAVPGSPANNQFRTPGGRPYVLEPGEFATWVYDGTGKWVLINDGDSEPDSVTAVQATCIPTAVGLDPLTAAPPSTGNHYPAGNIGYEFVGTSNIGVFGLQAKPNGTCCHWRNGSDKDVDFIHLSGGATAAGNRIALPESSTPGDTIKLKPGSALTMQYRTTTPAGSIIPGNVWVVTHLTEGE